jgi:hypothetical protein
MSDCRICGERTARRGLVLFRVPTPRAGRAPALFPFPAGIFRSRRGYWNLATPNIRRVGVCLLFPKTDQFHSSFNRSFLSGTKSVQSHNPRFRITVNRATSLVITVNASCKYLYLRWLPYLDTAAVAGSNPAPRTILPHNDLSLHGSGKTMNAECLNESHLTPRKYLKPTRTRVIGEGVKSPRIVFSHYGNDPEKSDRMMKNDA